MLDASLLHPERPRPLRRAEYERLVALGAFELRPAAFPDLAVRVADVFA